MPSLPKVALWSQDQALSALEDDFRHHLKFHLAAFCVSKTVMACGLLLKLVSA